MKKVLLTGGSGFIGRNIKDILKREFDLKVPTRKELNLNDELLVKEYLINEKFDVVIHCANPNPVKNSIDDQAKFLEDSLRCFMNLYKYKDYYDKLFYLGSGAEYNKAMDIISATEQDEFRSIPLDAYGFAKYIMNTITFYDDKICNIRIFACYGPTDHESKFITHCINCCLKNENITIRQNCYFDYMHVYDLGKIFVRLIKDYPNTHSLNVCSGKRISLVEIAQTVKTIMKSNSEIIVLKDGMNKEYTGSNKKLLDLIGNYQYISLDEGIKIQIESQKDKVI